MAIQTAAAAGGTGVQLSNSVRTQYQELYEQEVYYSRFYDQLAMAVPENSEMIRGDQVDFRFLSKMDIGTSAISEVQDITPQALKDATANITPTSLGEALQISQQMEIQNFLDNYMEKLSLNIAENAAESIDVLARNSATQGTLVQRTAARASLDAGTTGHRMTEGKFANAASRLADLKAPMFEGIGEDGGPTAAWGAFTDPFVFADLRQDGNIQAIGQYQRAGIHLNYELGSIGPFRLVVSNLSKIFYGAGIDAADVVATTLNAATTKLAKSLTVAANTHMDQTEGKWVNVGTEETADTHQAENERVILSSFTGSTGTIVGQGPNGGLRFSHPAKTPVRNADSVHMVVYGGPSSLVKVFAPEVGEFGEVVGPKRDGVVDQFWTLGWKWWGAYGRVAENRLMREEVSVSDEHWT